VRQIFNSQNLSGFPSSAHSTNSIAKTPALSVGF